MAADQQIIGQYPAAVLPRRDAGQGQGAAGPQQIPDLTAQGQQRTGSVGFSREMPWPAEALKISSPSAVMRTEL